MALKSYESLGVELKSIQSELKSKNNQLQQIEKQKSVSTERFRTIE